MLFTG
jgi:hypothetical protein